MKLRLWIFSVAAGVCILGCIGGCALWSLNPIHRDEAGIRIYLLQKTPLGSSIHDVEVVFAHEGWKGKINWVWDPKDPKAAENLRMAETFYPGVKGVKIIGADIGEYHAPWDVWIDAYWGFDSSGKLIDVHVRRMVDSL